MDILGPTLVLYLLVGAGIAVAIYLSPIDGRVNVVLAIPFWPLYLPLLLTRPKSSNLSLSIPGPLPQDAMTAAILQVDCELSAVGPTAPSDDAGRVRERLMLLHATWIAQAERIRAMDRLLALPDYAADSAEPPTTDGCMEISDRIRESRVARHENVERLRQVRHETFDDLMATLARVRELVSIIHLAQFSGAPPSRVQELLDQLVATAGDVGRGDAPDGDSETGIQARRRA